MGNPAWAEREKFTTFGKRKENEAELNRHIEEWTGEHYGDWLMAELIGNGVKAGVVNDARGVIEDDHLRKREFWTYLDHPVMGRTLYNRAPIRFSKTPLELRTPAPLLGQDTRQILTGMLGYTNEEVDRLKAEDVLT